MLHYFHRLNMGRNKITDSARKRNIRDSNRKRDATRIYLLGSYPRWKDLQNRRGDDDHVSMASHLLDIHDRFCQCVKGLACPVGEPMDHDETLTASESGSIPRPMSPDADFSLPPGTVISTPIRPAHCHRPVPQVDASLIVSETPRERLQPDLSSLLPRVDSPGSFVDDLMELEGQQDERGPSTNADFAEVEADVIDPNDTGATIGESVDLDTLEDDLLLLSIPETDQQPQTNMPDSTEPILHLVQAQKCIAYLDPILDLVKFKAGTQCTRDSCREPLEFNHQMIGTALYVKWSCAAGHHCGRWASQPKFKKMFAGNLQLASDILMSGNSFRKISLLFSFLNLGCVSETSFYDVQRLYALPAIEMFWSAMQRDMMTTILRRGGEVRVAGDGRNDSPGHCAQYCTYSLVDLETDAVLHLEIVDVREATSSQAMEKVGFQRAIDYLLHHNLTLKEVVTDQNSSIIKLMREHDVYKNILHQCDIWHAAKNLEKKLTAACKPRSLLRQWIPAIKNHFWWSSESCDGDTLTMKETWVRLLCHVTNQHEWVGGECSHAPINTADQRERPWLQKTSEEMNTLRQLITEPRFLKMFPYFKNYRHTGALEGFNNHVLMYCPKRISYQTTGYRARNLLAATDHNHHLHRPDHVNKAGDNTFHGLYNKRSKQWRAVRDKQEKNYSYKWDLQVMVFEEKERDTRPMKRKITLAHDDPRNICSTSAKRPCPPIADLVMEHISRMRQSKPVDIPKDLA